MSAEAEFLTADDVASLTEASQVKKQIEVLDRLGVPYILSPKGRPQISRYHTRMIAQGLEVRQSVGVDFSKVR